MLAHGSRLLGLVRAGAYSLYGKPKYPVSGTDQVYGLNVARFLADNDRPDQLVLSLYGMLGASMTPDTFVSGEAATVAPLRGARYRSMYMPPNTASNSAFLETLRLMLVHETRDKDGSPVGLELAFATPRPWLGDGKTIAVERRADELRLALVLAPPRGPPRRSAPSRCRHAIRRTRCGCGCASRTGSSCGPCGSTATGGRSTGGAGRSTCPVCAGRSTSLRCCRTSETAFTPRRRPRSSPPAPPASPGHG